MLYQHLEKQLILKQITPKDNLVVLDINHNCGLLSILLLLFRIVLRLVDKHRLSLFYDYHDYGDYCSKRNRKSYDKH